AGIDSAVATVAAASDSVKVVAGGIIDVEAVGENITLLRDVYIALPTILLAPEAAGQADDAARRARAWAESADYDELQTNTGVTLLTTDGTELGTQSEVEVLGGEHSSKGWAAISEEHARQSGASATAAQGSATAAFGSASAAADSATAAARSASSASGSATNAAGSADSASEAKDDAFTYKNAAAESATAAASSASAAGTSAIAASASQLAAAASAMEAAASAAESADSAERAQAWAEGEEADTITTTSGEELLTSTSLTFETTTLVEAMSGTRSAKYWARLAAETVQAFMQQLSRTLLVSQTI
ncbi:MAG: hypothetical protein IJ233_00035, partial [Pyramidobacter sp.]|nr:hypothetical protein [Pyramidobacter sp.]